MQGRLLFYSKALLLCRFFWLPLLMPVAGVAQANIGGIVNSYYKVTATNVAQSSVDLPSTSGLSLYDNVMIIQMKGATINTGNNNTFGDISSYNDAGSYEINTICGLEPTRVYLLNKLSHTYDPANGFVQLVRIPTYANANIITTLLAQPWDKLTGTGGVLAIIVNGTLNVQSDLSVTGVGFKGGDFKQLTGTCTNFVFFTNYFYNTTAITNGGNFKGEGIADLAATFSGGRGAAANAGGGGNDHNTGGGGGGNLSSGGNGGNNTSTAGCRGNYPAIGAYGLNSTGNRIFLGGGGGTGHDDGTDVTTGGGNGGGIVFIKAVELSGNGHTISANGLKGTSTVGDGASGGGAGGTIVMDIQTYTGTINTEAMGGDGGDEDNFNIAGRCYGTGGGGGGGSIYYTGLLPAASVNNINAGAAGTAFNSSPLTCNGITGATDGAAGNVNSNYLVSVSNIPETFCNSLLSSRYIALTITKNSRSANILKWKIQGIEGADNFVVERSFDGLSWSDIKQVIYQTGSNHFQFVDEIANMPSSYYRIKARMSTGIVYYSNVVYAKATGPNNWIIVSNPVRDYLYISGQSAEASPIFIYDATGKLVKQFTASPFTQPQQLNVSTIPKGIYYVRYNDVVKGFLKE